MAAGSEPGAVDDKFIDAVRLRYAALRPGEVPLMSDDDERGLLEATANTAMTSARDENLRPRARVQLLQGAAEVYAFLDEPAKAIEVLTLANQILPTVMVRKRRAELCKVMDAAKHEEPPAGERPWASASQRRGQGQAR